MNVLLATDGKEHSLKAVNYAFEYASLHKATLVVVFVVSPKAEEDREKLIKTGMGVLENMKNIGVEKGVPVIILLEAGSPYESILHAADRLNTEVIVVGTSGKTAIDRVLIGSVSEYVVRNAKVTVIVVR